MESNFLKLYEWIYDGHDFPSRPNLQAKLEELKLDEVSVLYDLYDNKGLDDRPLKVENWGTGTPKYDKDLK